MPGDLDRGALTEHEIEWHFIYAEVFGDPEVREKALKRTRVFREKGILAPLIEFGSEE